MGRGSGGTTGTEPYRWRPWKIAGVAAAGLLVVAGGALALLGVGAGTPAETPVAGADRLEPSVTRTEPGGGPESLLPGIPPPGPGPDGPIPSPEDAPAEPVVDEDGGIAWSPALLRGGLSFFVALAVGYALRTFLRIGLFFLGIWAASIFVLARVGWVEVHWDLVDAAFERWASGLAGEFESFARFVTGSLPSAGMAGLGLYTGLRRR